jgi:hypothetical protein
MNWKEFEKRRLCLDYLLLHTHKTINIKDASLHAKHGMKLMDFSVSKLLICE